MTRFGKVAAASVVSALILASCGGSDGTDDTSASTTERPSTTVPTESSQPSTTKSSGGPAAETDAVRIAAFAFDPDPVEVKVGATVTWTNEDPDVHTATSEGDVPKKFDTGELAEGSAGRVTFDKPGTYTYYCDIHNYMTGTVTVVE